MPPNPKSFANLRPQKAGEPSHNPEGHNGSEERYLTGLLRDSAKEIPKGEVWDKLRDKRGEFKGKTLGQLLEMALWEEAIIRREPQAFKTIIERCDGRLPLALTGEDGGPVLFSESPLKSLSDTELDERIRALEEQKVGKLPNGKKKNGKSNGSI
jgi:hypothetical protein